MIRSTTMEATRQEGRQESLLQVLRLKFQQEIPTQATAAIRACNQLERLNIWFEIAIATDSLDLFRQRAGI